ADNAHGAYLRFLSESRFPIDLGADMCCSSAHKTLPVLTGGAYLHISDRVTEQIAAQAKNSLSLFGSTSPSYLILQSLDKANEYLEGYGEKLGCFIPMVNELKQKLKENCLELYGNEPLKITIKTKPMGYYGTEIADMLAQKGIICEFADPDYIVFMLSPETGAEGLSRLEEALLSIRHRRIFLPPPPAFAKGEKLLSIREAALAPMEMIPVGESKGRILGAVSVGCPPAVPILVCGERIDENAIACFEYYGIKQCGAVKE
ncbi:MAG: amino acid decarboxylase, partial [Clostridia bacterium]|nr:amino acid decarboxylase [Clostridia bacterium]